MPCCYSFHARARARAGAQRGATGARGEHAQRQTICGCGADYKYKRYGAGERTSQPESARTRCQAQKSHTHTHTRWATISSARGALWRAQINVGYSNAARPPVDLNIIMSRCCGCYCANQVVCVRANECAFRRSTGTWGAIAAPPPPLCFVSKTAAKFMKSLARAAAARRAWHIYLAFIWLVQFNSKQRPTWASAKEMTNRPTGSAQTWPHERARARAKRRRAPVDFCVRSGRDDCARCASAKTMLFRARPVDLNAACSCALAIGQQQQQQWQ